MSTDKERLNCSFDDVYEPVYIKNSEMLVEKWLKVTQKEQIDDKRPMRQMLEDPMPLIKTVKFQLFEPSTYQCKKCGAVIQSKREPETCSQCQRPSTFDIVLDSLDVPKSLWLLPIWEDVDVDMLGVYDDIVDLLKRTIKFVEEIHYKIFALWIIATYKHPLWETIPYLHFKGLPASGKTRAMEVAQRLAYRSVLVSSITFTAVVRVNHNYSVTLLIDEIDTKTDERTEGGREYVDFLKSGYKKGAMYIASDLNDQKKVIAYNNYGPKILTGEKGIYSESLLSRTLIFDMEQDYPEVFALSEVEEECEILRTKLINYRYKTNTPAQLETDVSLKARMREIFDCLFRTAKHIGITTGDILDYAKAIEEEAINEMQGTVQWDILNIIAELSCEGIDDAKENIKLNDIVEKLGWEEEVRKGGQKVGYILKNLGLKTKRKRDGTVIQLTEAKNERKLRYLFKRYRINKPKQEQAKGYF